MSINVLIEAIPLIEVRKAFSHSYLGGNVEKTCPLCADDSQVRAGSLNQENQREDLSDPATAGAPSCFLFGDKFTRQQIVDESWISEKSL